MNRRDKHPAAVCGALLTLFLLPLGPRSDAEPASDWPRWLGPRGDATAAGTGLFPDGVDLTLREAWRRPIGKGYSSISVAGGRAYAFEFEGGEDRVLALEPADGRELWRFVLDRPDDGPNLGPMSTPAIDGGRIFVLNERGKLHALDAASGMPLWSHDLVAEFGASPLSHGIATSPLVAGGRVIVLVGGREAHNLAAFDAASGELAWSVFPARQGSYSSPVLGELGGRRQIVVPASDQLYGLAVEDGRLLWTREGLRYPDRNPLLLPGDRILMALETEAVMLELDGGPREMRLEELWRSAVLEYSYSPTVYHDGALYGFGGSSLTCLDAASGKVRWQERIGEGMLILIDGHLLVLEQMTGRLRLVAADPLGYRERLSVQALTAAVSYTPPSFAEGRVFLRNEKEIAAFELVEGETREAPKGSEPLPWAPKVLSPASQGSRR